MLAASSVASGAAIAVCFSAEEDCAAFAVRAINNAEREILVGAYRMTTGSGIVEALVRAKERGVDVRLIADGKRCAILLGREANSDCCARGHRGGRQHGADTPRASEKATENTQKLCYISINSCLPCQDAHQISECWCRRCRTPRRVNGGQARSDCARPDTWRRLLRQLRLRNDCID